MDDPFYKRDGRVYDRVGSVLGVVPSPGLLSWKIKVGKVESGKVSRKALKVGSRVDELCQTDWEVGTWDAGKKEAPEVVSCMEGWEAWKRDHRDVFLDIRAAQETVYYDDWGVAGTLDFRTGTGLIDVKTSKVISPDYWLQLAAYNREYKKESLWVLDLSKDLGEYRFVKCPYEQEYLEQVFIGRLINYRYLQAEGEIETWQ